MRWGKSSLEAVVYPTDAESHAHMAERQRQNREKCKENGNENWMAEILRGTHLKWTRQSQCGIRLFDFWSHQLGVAVEIDGPGHDAERDATEDEWLLKRRGIIVIRVRNGSTEDATTALSGIAELRFDTWGGRRERMGLLTKAEKAARKLAAC